jgi:hypothetical protein
LGDRELTGGSSGLPSPWGDRRIKPGEKLGDAYFDASLPVVREQLYPGGGRLALVLNAALSDD